MRRWRKRFQGLIRPLLGKSEAELDRWRDALGDALGPNGRLIVSLVPESKLLIGEQPRLWSFPRSRRKAASTGVPAVLGVFARPDHPLALFLDDLQWLDAATLKLLENLSTQPDVRRLLVIGAYRDNEVDTSPPAARQARAIRDAEH